MLQLIPATSLVAYKDVYVPIKPLFKCWKRSVSPSKGTWDVQYHVPGADGGIERGAVVAVSFNSEQKSLVIRSIN